MKKKHGNVFACYSIPLMKYLTEVKNHKYELVGLSPTSHKKFWLFLLTSDLDRDLKEWSR